jgi:hypothetical protein
MEEEIVALRMYFPSPICKLSVRIFYEAKNVFDGEFAVFFFFSARGQVVDGFGCI